jgi:hypothetical protein
MSSLVFPPSSAVPLDLLRGDDELDHKLLLEMADEAIRYISGFEWCIGIHERYFGDGFGGIVALFIFRVSIRDTREPEWIWVIVGDLPSAYLETKGFPSAQAALERYIEGVEDWIDTPERERRTRTDLPPISMPSGDEHIQMLKSRMDTLRASFLPHLKLE